MLTYRHEPTRISREVMANNNIFSPRTDRLVANEAGVWSLMLRDMTIAKWNDEELFILCGFRQEVEEVSHRIWLDSMKIEKSNGPSAGMLWMRLRKMENIPEKHVFMEDVIRMRAKVAMEQIMEDLQPQEVEYDEDHDPNEPEDGRF